MTRPQLYALCIKNRGCPAALELRKVYRRILDPAAAKRGLVPIIDESDEDYLYPAERFVPIDLPRTAAVVFVTESS
ncbi:MAG TPA: hypothetical protein VK348_00575 [Planctomycetota bacterium]|nr:hypothetical protein [Planctomycetota bacterium]